MAAVRDIARKGNDDARKPYMGIVEGVLKLFGTNPATRYRRMNSPVNSFIKGVDYRYTSTSDRSGVMDVEYHAESEIPICIFVSLTPTFETLLNSCGAKGVVAQPERTGPNKARFKIQ